MAVYGYARSSDTEDPPSPEELAGQLSRERRQLETFAHGRGLRLDHCLQDSGLKWTLDLAKRPQGARLLESLQAGDSILTLNLPRMFSNCEDLDRTVALLRKRRVALLVVDLGGDICDDAFRLPVSRLLKTFARLEKRRATERIKSVKERERRKGRFLGGSRPFGYMIHSNGRLIENPMEQRVLKKIIEMKNQGKSLRAISEAVSTPLTPISFKTVQRVLKRQEAMTREPAGAPGSRGQAAG